MKQKWKVKLLDNPKDEDWLFDTKVEAIDFVENRYGLATYLGYNPDDTYYLIPIE
jgi:hypothetical protein|tara:strand:+ start:891 stop:1055 length:165 start_codon:yes stop_codon:yes gene_type:complete